MSLDSCRPSRAGKPERDILLEEKNPAAVLHHSWAWKVKTDAVAIC